MKEPKASEVSSVQMPSIELQITNFTALSVEILDDVLTSTPYSNFSLYPCEINYLKTHTIRDIFGS